jgi:ABC-type thiamine transport system ATPase subunit
MTKRLAVCFIALIAGFATPTSAQEKQGHNVWRCLMQIVPPLRRSVLSMLQIRSDALFSLQTCDMAALGGLGPTLRALNAELRDCEPAIDRFGMPLVAATAEEKLSVQNVVE